MFLEQNPKGTAVTPNVERKRVRVAVNSKYLHKQVFIEELPIGWTAFVGADTGCVYFQNEHGHQQNEVPPGFSDGVAGDGDSVHNSSSGAGAGIVEDFLRAGTTDQESTDQKDYHSDPFVFGGCSGNGNLCSGDLPASMRPRANSSTEVLWGDGVALTPSRARVHGGGGRAFRSHSHGASLSPTTRFSVFSPTIVKVSPSPSHFAQVAPFPLDRANSNSINDECDIPGPTDFLRRSISGRDNPSSMQMLQQCVDGERGRCDSVDSEFPSPSIHIPSPSNHSFQPPCTPNPNPNPHRALSSHSRNSNSFSGGSPSPALRCISVSSNASRQHDSLLDLSNPSFHFLPIDSAQNMSSSLAVATNSKHQQSTYSTTDSSAVNESDDCMPVDEITNSPPPLIPTTNTSGMGNINISNSPLWYEEAEVDDSIVYNAT